VTRAKLAQATALGARVIEVRGSFDQALSAARALNDRGTHVLVNSLNPHRLEGQKTAAFELVEELGGAPAVLAIPYGGGGNLRAYARGFDEAEAGMPRIVAGEAAQRATTVASAIRITDPAHGEEAGEAVRTSGGRVVALSDDAILRAWRNLAHEEGVLCEPSSAASVAALVEADVEPGARVVCVLTGHGLKDAETAARESPPSVVVDPDPDAIAEASS
jgi:threonine synthase